MEYKALVELANKMVGEGLDWWMVSEESFLSLEHDWEVIRDKEGNPCGRFNHQVWLVYHGGSEVVKLIRVI